MDPRNFLNEVRIFQFEALSFDEYSDNLDAVEKILYGTEFYNNKVSYLDSNGNIINMSEKYSDLILRAGRISLVSPYHLASRIKQEVGPFLSHSSISGNVEGFKGLYNFYNIGATSSSEPMGAIKNGLRYARDGNGASEETKRKYLIPWNTKERSITGGGIFIGSSYINVGQNNIYLQKFDVIDHNGDGLFWHQYMTNVLAPYSESKSIYNGYSKSNLLDLPINFVIPIYDNMPEIPVQSPSINQNDFYDDNKTTYSTATNDKMTRLRKGKQSGEKWDMVKLENGIIGYIYHSYVTENPPVQIENIELSIDNTTINKGDTKKLNVKITPEEAKGLEVAYTSSNPNVAIVDNDGNIKGISSGEAVITVKAKDNNVQAQINIKVYSKVTGIVVNENDVSIQIEDSFKLKAEVEPDDADNKEISYISENTDIAIVEEDGTIIGKKEGKTKIIISSKENPSIYKECVITVVRKMEDSEIHFDNSLVVEGLEISGIDYKNNKVSDIKNLITTDLELEFVNYKGEILNDNSLLGTGSKIRVKENGVVLREYKIILYGDSNGDGRINSVDLLVLQRHILEIESLDDIFIKASNVRRVGVKPTSVDLLLIQRHILGLQEIKQ